MRPLQENIAKKNFSVSLNPELVAFLKEKGQVENLSAWINEKMREFRLARGAVLVCPCGVSSGRKGWAKWKGICPVCKHDHATEDKRTRE